MTPEEQARELYLMSEHEPPRPPMTVWDRFILIGVLSLSAFITWSCIKVMYNAGLFVL